MVWVLIKSICRGAPNEFPQYIFMEKYKVYYVESPILSRTNAVFQIHTRYAVNVLKFRTPKLLTKKVSANSADPDPEGAVWSGSTLFAIALSF